MFEENVIFFVIFCQFIGGSWGTLMKYHKTDPENIEVEL